MILYVISITLAVIVVILTLQYLIGRTRGSATLMGVSLKQMGISLVVAAVIGHCRNYYSKLQSQSGNTTTRNSSCKKYLIISDSAQMRQ